VLHVQKNGKTKEVNGGGGDREKIKHYSKSQQYKKYVEFGTGIVT
jgi:hypothetical protein